MLFRVLVFVLLVVAGYFSSRKIKGNRFSITLVSTLLVVILAAVFILGKKLWAMFGFSMYLMLIILGFAAGILAGLSNKKQPVDQKSLPAAKSELKKLN